MNKKLFEDIGKLKREELSLGIRRSIWLKKWTSVYR